MKQATAFVLHVGTSMATTLTDPTTHSEETRLQSALNVLNKRIEFTTLFNATDEMGIFLYGTNDTEHELDEEKYTNITTFNQIEKCSLAMLNKVKEITTSDHSKGDAVNACSLALELLQRRTKNKKYEKNIVLITDCGGAATELEAEEIDRFVGQAEDMGCRFNVICLDLATEIKTDPESSSTSTSSTSSTSNTIQDPRFIHANTLKSLFETRLKGTFKRPGSIQELIGYVPRQKRAKTKTYQHTLSLTNELDMNIKIFKLTMEEKFPASKKKSLLSSDGESGKVDRSTSYKSRSTDVDEEIAPGNLISAYPYGKELVPFTAADKESIAYKSTQCLKIIGFIPKNKINRAQFLNGADIVLPQENENVAATTMSALVHAMEENQVYAIARYVIKKDKGPKVVCLSPHIERTPDGRLLECMVLNYLPFAEDLRPFHFKSLKAIELTTDQEKAADALIDSMDLSNASATGNEALKPSFTYNPTLQYFYACLSARAQNKDSIIVPKDVLASTSSSSTNTTNNETVHGLPLPTLNAPQGCFNGKDMEAIRLFKTSFPTVLKDQGTKKKRHWGANKSTNDNDGSAEGSSKGSKRAKTTTSAATGGSGGTSVLGQDKSKVVAEFERLVDHAEDEGDSSLIAPLLRAMRDMLESVAFGGSNDSHVTTQQLVVTMLSSFRKGAITLYEPSFYNMFARAFRSRCVKDNVKDVWSWMVESKNGLIISSETNADGDGANEEEAIAFLMDLSTDGMEKETVAAVVLAVESDDDDMDLE